MSKFKVGDKVVVTKSTNIKNNFNEVGAVGTVCDIYSNGYPSVDFGLPDKIVIDSSRVEHYTDKMKIGKRYRQNSTDSEVICIGHDQGKCVVRFIDDKNRTGQDRYQSRCGKVGSDHQYHWTEIGVIEKVKCQVFLTCTKGVRNLRGAGSLSNVEYTFEDDKLINVEILKEN